MENEERLDAIFYALSDRRRRMLLAELAAGPKTVSELAVTVQMNISAASKHIAILETAQLIYKTRQQRQTYCHLHFDVWRDVSNYIGMHAKFWSGRLDELASYIKETGAK